jgi:hypothetical protein
MEPGKHLRWPAPAGRSQSRDTRLERGQAVAAEAVPGALALDLALHQAGVTQDAQMFDTVDWASGRSATTSPVTQVSRAASRRKILTRTG